MALNPWVQLSTSVGKPPIQSGKGLLAAPTRKFRRCGEIPDTRLRVIYDADVRKHIVWKISHRESLLRHLSGPLTGGRMTGSKVGVERSRRRRAFNRKVNVDGHRSIVLHTRVHTLPHNRFSNNGEFPVFTAVGSARVYVWMMPNLNVPPGCRKN